MTRENREVRAGTFDGVRISPTLRLRHRQRVGRDELVKRAAMAVQSDVTALRLRDLQQVGAHSGKVDGLCRCGSFIGHRHLPQIILVHAEEDCCDDEDAGQGAHVRIVALRRSSIKTLMLARTQFINTARQGTAEPVPTPVGSRAEKWPKIKGFSPWGIRPLCRSTYDATSISCGGNSPLSAIDKFAQAAIYITTSPDAFYSGCNDSLP